MGKKDRLHKKALRYQDPDHWVAFKKQRNVVSRIVKESRNDYLNSDNAIGASLQENPKTFWPYVDLVNQRTLVYPLCDMVITCRCTSDNSKADALNSYFYSVFTQEKLPTPTKTTSPFNQTLDVDISAHGVHKQFNPRKACGPDEIPARVLKELAPYIAPWLSSIFQQSYDTGAVPSDWTKALVTAINKKDSKSNPANYRPISLTSLCCKG